MRLEICFSDNMDLLEDDATLSLGFLIIHDNHDLSNSITLFKEKRCIVFIALTELLDCLLKLDSTNNAKWIVTDCGEIVEFLLKKDKMMLKYNDECRTFNYIKIKEAIINGILDLLSKIKSLNNKVVKESPFIDLYNTISLF